jgi:hypothetical protein
LQPLTCTIEWGPVGSWVGATATFLAALVALLVAMGLFDRFRGPRLVVTFEQAEPWCRAVAVPPDRAAFWVRVGVANVGRSPARGCVGRLTGWSTDGVVRTDIDPIQLSWAGIPRSRAFEPIDLRRGQREFLNVLVLVDGSRWRIDTFDADDFTPGFATELPSDQHHVVQVAVFADNAETVTRALDVDAGTQRASSLRLVQVGGHKGAPG